MEQTQLFDFGAFPTLSTAHLVLREIVATDAADVFVFWSDPEVQKYNAEPLKEVAEAAASIERIRQWYIDKQEVIWGATLIGEDKVIGSFSLFDWQRYHNRAQLGYDLARSYWGQGLASEAVAAVLRFGFERMNLHRIEAYTIIDNYPSVRMLKRLGFQLEGVRREYSWEEDGTYHGSGVFGLLRHEFRG